MAIIYVAGTKSDHNATKVSISCSAPPTISSGDFLIAVVVKDQDTGNITPNETGWTKILDRSETGGRDRRVWCGYRFASAGEAASYSWEDTAAAGSAEQMGVLIHAFSGVNPNQPISGFTTANHYGEAQNTINPTPKDVSTSIDACMIMLFQAQTHDDITAVGSAPKDSAALYNQDESIWGATKDNRQLFFHHREKTNATNTSHTPYEHTANASVSEATYWTVVAEPFVASSATVSGAGSADGVVATLAGVGEREITAIGSVDTVIATFLGVGEREITGTGSADAPVITASGVSERTIVGIGRPTLDNRTNWVRATDSPASGYSIDAGPADAASPITGFNESVQFLSAPTAGSFQRAYNPGGSPSGYTPSPDPRSLRFSFYIEMDDGGAPVVGNSSGADLQTFVGGTFAGGGAFTYLNVAGNTWLVTAYSFADAGALGDTGIYKYTTNSARRFKTTGWQLEVTNDNNDQPASPLIETSITASASPLGPFPVVAGVGIGPPISPELGARYPNWNAVVSLNDRTLGFEITLQDNSAVHTARLRNETSKGVYIPDDFHSSNHVNDFIAKQTLMSDVVSISVIVP